MQWTRGGREEERRRRRRRARGDEGDGEGAREVLRRVCGREHRRQSRAREACVNKARCASNEEKRPMSPHPAHT